MVFSEVKESHSPLDGHFVLTKMDNVEKITEICRQTDKFVRKFLKYARNCEAMHIFSHY